MNVLGKVVGITTQQYIYSASQTRKFRMNEILIVKDENYGDIKCEVIETQSFNKFIPLTNERSKFVDSDVMESLKYIGFNIEGSETHIAKLRILTEMLFPVTTGSNIRIPLFEEVRENLLKTTEGFNLGLLRGTEDLFETMDNNLKEKGVIISNNRYLEFNAVPFIFNYKAMFQYPHIGFFGGSGSGKSYGLRTLIEEIMEKRIPAILTDSHYEMDFSMTADNLPEKYVKNFSNRFTIYTLGQDIGIPFTELSENDFINILKASSENLTDNMDNIARSIFSYNDTVENFKFKLETIIKYTKNPNAETPNEREFRILNLYGTNFNIAGLEGVSWRFNRLIKLNIFNHGITNAISDLHAKKLVVLRGPINSLQIFTAFFYKKIYGLRRNFKDSLSQGNNSINFFPPFIIINDEAHDFAPKNRTSPSKLVIKEISQEGRKYGAFLVLATQRPALLDETVIAQLNTKFIFRTTRSQDIALLKEETDITAEDSKRLPYLPSGEAFVSSAIYGKTMTVKIRAALTKPPITINPFDELNFNETPTYCKNNEKSDILQDLIQTKLPIESYNLINIVREIEEQLNILLTTSELENILEHLCLQNKIKKDDDVFGFVYSKI